VIDGLLRHDTQAGAIKKAFFLKSAEKEEAALKSSLLCYIYVITLATACRCTQ
jgi:hypothetical protein